MMEELVAVVLVNHNNDNDVLRIFESLKIQSYQNYLLIVVDDNSSDCSKLKEVEDEKFALTHYPKPFKVGYANKHNFGFIEAIKNKAKYVYKMHTDMEIISTSLLSSLVEEMNRDPDIVCVGPRIFNGDGHQTWGPGIVKIRCGHEIRVHESYLLRVSYLLNNRGFQDEVFDWFGEEMDFFVRIKKNGKQVSQINEKIVHFGGATSASFRVAKCRYRADSSMVFLFKHNRHLPIFKTVRMYLREIRIEVIFILDSLKNGHLWVATRSIINLSLGACLGAYKIIAKKYDRYPTL